MKTCIRGLCGALVLALVCVAGAGREEPTLGGSVQPMLPTEFGAVITGVAHVEVVEPDPRVKNPQRSIVIVFRAVDGKPLGEPVSLSAVAFHQDDERTLREWAAAPAREERTVYGYETVRMEGIPNGIRRHAAMRNYPIPAGPSFVTRHVFVLMMPVASRQEGSSTGDER